MYRTSMRFYAALMILCCLLCCGAVYKQVTTQSALAWQRVRLACQMATDGFEWGQIISDYNSGTYNNQYVLLLAHF